jgi:hypothetical protein
MIFLSFFLTLFLSLQYFVGKLAFFSPQPRGWQSHSCTSPARHAPFASPSGSCRACRTASPAQPTMCENPRVKYVNKSGSHLYVYASKVEYYHFQFFAIF